MYVFKKWEEAPGKPTKYVFSTEEINRYDLENGRQHELLSRSWRKIIDICPFYRFGGNPVVEFDGRGLRGFDGLRSMITGAMLGSLGAFEYAYNRYPTSCLSSLRSWKASGRQFRWIMTFSKTFTGVMQETLLTA